MKDEEGPATIWERFFEFHENHPEVYDALVVLCDQWIAHGDDRWSIDACFQVLRWERRIAGLPDEYEDYKLNSIYSSRYARFLMMTERFVGLFETRELKSE